MAIVDDVYSIRQHHHGRKLDEACVASGAVLDNIGAEYLVFRGETESDNEFRERVSFEVGLALERVTALKLEMSRR